MPDGSIHPKFADEHRHNPLRHNSMWQVELVKFWRYLTDMNGGGSATFLHRQGNMTDEYRFEPNSNLEGATCAGQSSRRELAANLKDAILHAANLHVRI